jgi:ABC-type multidrug transport system fused ATPase/permease subunit
MNTALLTPDVRQEDTRTLLPVTERLLAKLPGKRWVWLTLWSLVPVVRVLVIVPMLVKVELSLQGLGHVWMALFEVLVWSSVLWLSFWGINKFAKDVLALEPNLSQLLGKHNYTAKYAFRGMESTLGPILLTLSLTLIFELEYMVNGFWLLALLNLPFALLSYFPLTTWFWNYIVLMIGLNRLGEQHLELESYSGDKSMGLKPVGALAFSGFRVFALILGPILLINISYTLALVVGLLFFVVGVVTFFLSLYRIHGQMILARKQEIAKAKKLYAEAYEPLRSAPSLELLQKQAPLLSAAEALEKRLEGIQTWPFSDAIFVRIVAIATSVVTAIIVKLILIPLGM